MIVLRGRGRRRFRQFGHGRQDASESALRTIRVDVPRTFPGEPFFVEHADTLTRLLTTYAAVQRGDGYLQGFNLLMSVLMYAFKDEAIDPIDKEADAWWCFARIVGLIRPLMPDFNMAWFEWCRRHWLAEFGRRLRKKRPRLAASLSEQTEAFSTLVTVKWFMLWFVCCVRFDEIFEVWDFLVEQPPRHLLRVYTLLAYEILFEAAPTLTYEASPAVLHALLDIRVSGVGEMLRRVRTQMS